MGARQVAMGNTGLASTSGASALFWNPAGVAGQKGYEMQFNNLDWFGGVEYRHFTGVTGLGEVGAIGFSVQYLAYPDIIETTEDAPDGTGATFKPYDLAVVLNYSRAMTDKVLFGINAKYINETIALVSANAFAFDIGLLYKAGFQGLQFGFLISNYGTKGQFEGSGLRRFILRSDGPPNQTPVPVMYEADKIELPSSVQLGVSVMPLKSENFSLVANADQVVNAFSNDRTKMGVEANYNDMFFLRGGYLFTTDYNTDANKGNATFGAGVRYTLENTMTVSFDYGFSDLGLLNNAHYVTVGLEF